jgi:hypothetical protein
VRPLIVRACLALALCVWPSVWPAHAAPDPSSPPPAGHTRTLAAQRTPAAPTIDGRVVEAEWTLGETATGFWVSEWKQPPTDDTQVVVLYDDTTLYIAITCLDAKPSLIRATQIVRDASPGVDDRVTVELDPHHNHRSVSRFTVTARGTQVDALAGGRAGQAGWKGTWQAAARRTPTGWTAELAIPFALLAVAPDAGTIGVNFSRYQHRTREWSYWADITPQKLPEEAGHLTGLRLPQTSATSSLALMQYLASNPRRTPDAPGENTAGADIRYQWGRGLTAMLSARPDFSGVDADVASVGFSYTERYVADRRPFFQEGQTFFGDRELFHSGRIEQFDVGVKTFGRVDAYQVGVLATTDANTGRVDYVGRVVREVGPAFNLSATVVGTQQEALENAAVQVRASGRVGPNLRVDGQVARTATAASSTGAASSGSATIAPAPMGDGGRERAEIAYRRAHWYTGGWADRTDQSFFAADGFLPGDIVGTSGRGAYTGYTRTSGQAWLRSTDASVSMQVRDTVSGLRQRESASVYVGAQTAANVQLNAGVTSGVYRPRGTSPGDWAGALHDDRSYLASAEYQSPTGHFGYGAQYTWGVAGPQAYDTLAPNLWLAPNPHLSVAYSFERATYDLVRRQHVVSGTWQIDPAQSLAARWVEDGGGYYRLSYRRSLARAMDAFGVYSSDPYEPRRFDLKLVWTLSALPQR